MWPPAVCVDFWSDCFKLSWTEKVESRKACKAVVCILPERGFSYTVDLYSTIQLVPKIHPAPPFTSNRKNMLKCTSMKKTRTEQTGQINYNIFVVQQLKIVSRKPWRTLHRPQMQMLTLQSAAQFQTLPLLFLLLGFCFCIFQSKVGKNRSE